MYYSLRYSGGKMNIIKISTDDLIELKKPHPCGSSLFKIVRVGSNVRIICCQCGRDMNIDRIKLEKSIKKVLKKEDTK